MGSGFDWFFTTKANTKLACAFGDAPQVEAKLESASVLRCVSPPQRANLTSVKVRVVAQGGGATYTSASFAYEPAPPFVESLAPRTGPTQGGTLVLVEAAGVGAELSCRFGLVATRAQGVNASHLRCTAPPQSTAGRVAVAVSTNGVDFGRSVARFAYAEPMQVDVAEPASGADQRRQTRALRSTFRLKTTRRRPIPT